MAEDINNLSVYYTALFLLGIFMCVIPCVKGQPVICDFPSSCKPGDLVSDPNDCKFYFECAADGTTFDRHECENDKHYDTGTNKCRIQRNAKCATVCDSDSNVFNELDNSGSVVSIDLTEDGREDHTLITNREPTVETLIEELALDSNASDTVSNQLSDTEANATEDSLPTKKMNVSDTKTSSSSTPQSTKTLTMAEPTSTILAAKETTEAAARVETTAKVILPDVTSKLDDVSNAPTAVAGVTEGQPSDVITGDGIEQTTAGNSTGTPGAVNGGLSTAMIGIIAGVVIGVIVLIILIVLLILLVRKRRNRSRHDIPKIENPQYATTAASKPTNYRFSRNSALYVGPTVNFQKMKSTPQDGDSLTKKKRPAPSVPTARQHLLRKKGPAPPPPGGFGDIEEEFHPDEEERPLTDIYEKDSNGGSAENLEMSTFTARNESAFLNNSGQDLSQHSPKKEPEEIGTGKDKAPLLERSKDDTGSPTTKDDVVRNGGIAGEKTLNQEELNNNKGDDEAVVDENELVNDPNETLLGPTPSTIKGLGTSSSRDNVSEDISLDDYDRTHNPFFS